MSKKQKHTTQIVGIAPMGAWAYCTTCEWMSDVIALYETKGTGEWWKDLSTAAHQHEKAAR